MSSGSNPPPQPQYTDEQRAVIENFGKGQAVSAGAGCGKTTTLVGKCLELLRRDSEARFVAVSFTERSVADLQEKISRDIPLHRHWVTTIHGFCALIARENPREAGLDGEETMLSPEDAEDLWRTAVSRLWFEELPPHVDEAVERLLERESRGALEGLLTRMKSLKSFGAMERLSELEGRDEQAALQVAQYVFEHYERRKRRLGVMDFDDLERAADRALESASVRAGYHTRFNLVLVDEFQDTNPVQARIIARFVRSDRSNLCVVGDPKQSIYRFRDADVTTFREFCASMPLRQSLTWNFRSRPGILNFVNSVCEPIFDESEMEYEHLVPRRSPGTHPPVERLDVQDPADLGRWIRGQVASGVPMRDLVLLLRKVRGADKWLSGLASAGVGIALGSGGMFWTHSAVRELVALLRWWDEPSNSLSGAIVLRAPWVSVPDLELNQWRELDPTWVKPFFESSHELADLLRPLRGRPVRPGELMLALLKSDRIESQIGIHVLGLWHRLEEWSSTGKDFHACVNEAVSAIDSGRRDPELPAPQGLEGQIRVLTIHGSKGLEFPHVVLLDFEGPKKRENSPLLYWDRDRGVYLGKRAESGDRDKKDPDEVTWNALEYRKNLDESKRLFYVALTRASERLVLVFSPEKELSEKKKKELEKESVALRDDWRGWIEERRIELPPARILDPGEPSALSESASAWIPPDPVPASDVQWVRPRHSVTEWALLARCPLAYERRYIRPVRGAEAPVVVDELPDGDRAPLTAREIGTRVHACLEANDLEGLRRIEEEVGAETFRADPVVEWAQRSEWMKGSAQSELAFEVPVHGEVLVGAMDRLVGKTIIDFKVVRRGKDPEDLLDAYALQMRLYAWALGKLGPDFKNGVRAILVQFARDRVSEVEVDVQNFDDSSVIELLNQSRAIVEGASGEARRNSHCQFCDYRSDCPAWQGG